jgi:hypothetical protein
MYKADFDGVENIWQIDELLDWKRPPLYLPPAYRVESRGLSLYGKGKHHRASENAIFVNFASIAAL